jgi:hypothetical protein
MAGGIMAKLNLCKFILQKKNISYRQLNFGSRMEDSSYVIWET